MLRSASQSIFTFSGRLTCKRGVVTTNSSTFKFPHIFCKLVAIIRFSTRLALIKAVAELEAVAAACLIETAASFN